MNLSTNTWMARNLAGIMDEARRQMAIWMERLADTADDQFADGFTHLIASVEASFRDEESAMEALHYPSLRSHREQHARALGALHHAQPHVEEGDIGLGREALELLQKWLLMHRLTMDLALASAARERTGGRRHPAIGRTNAMPERHGRHHKGQALV